MNLPDGLLELFMALFVVLQHTDAEWLKWFSDFVPQNAESLGGVGGDQYAFALRQKMAEQICNGMCLPGAGRTLDQHAFAVGQLAGNLQLLAVGRLAQ